MDSREDAMIDWITYQMSFLIDYYDYAELRNTNLNLFVLIWICKRFVKQ